MNTLDLPAYLERIGVDGELPPTQATLARLHRAHVTTVPFANVDVIRGHRVSLELADVQDKLVTRRRGGYCFEHATLFAAALEALGFATTPLLARVGPDDGPLRVRTHLLLRVGTAEEGDWLADVGYGVAMLDPLPFAADAQARMGVWEHRLQALDEARWRLQTRDASGWRTEHVFELAAQPAVDIEMANHYASTHPRALFVRHLVAMRAGEDARHRLVGHTLERLTPESTERTVLDGAGVVDALQDVFGVRLDDADRAAVVAL